MKTFTTILAAGVAVCALSITAQAQTLKASHQFPGGKGDPRDEMVQIIAKEAKAANVGLDVQVYPGRLAVQAERPVERHGQRPARHLVLPARLRQRQGARLRRDADARAWYATTSVPQKLNNSPVHEGHQGQDRQGRRDRAGRCLARRRGRLQEGLHPQAGRHQGPEDPLGRTDLRRDVAGGRRFDRLDPEQRGLQRAADRRRRRHRHLDRQLRLVPHLRAGQVHHRAGRQRAVVHVRAGADVEEELRPSSTSSSRMC